MTQSRFLTLVALVIFVFMIFCTCGDEMDDNECEAENKKSENDDEEPEETWVDSTTGLMWQNSDDCCYNWHDSMAYCEELALGGYDDWRLPTISEFRSLVRGCSSTATGGACPVTDDCTQWEKCWRGNSCYNSNFDCEELGGPGPDGRYWPEELEGQGFEYWSSTIATYISEDRQGQCCAWYFKFDWGGITHGSRSCDDSADQGYVRYLDVRCVR